MHFSARNGRTFACFLRCSKCVPVQLCAVTPYSVDKIRKSILYAIKYIYQPPIFMVPFIWSRPAFLILWSADHKWSSGSALVVLLDWTLVQKYRKNKIKVNCVSQTIVENLKQSLEITYNKRLQTFSARTDILWNLLPYLLYCQQRKRIFCCKNMFRTLFRAGLMSLIIPRVGWSVEHSD